MNRIIKFRAWDKVTKKMVDIDLLDFATTETHRAWRASVGESWLIQFGKEHRTKDEIELMQFTGLYDKNGKEVYEGDIVQIYKHMSSEKSEVTQVIWDEENCEYKGIYPNIAIWVAHEVIGNIYENPELITSFKEAK